MACNVLQQHGTPIPSFLARDIRDGRFSGPKNDWPLGSWWEVPILLYHVSGLASIYRHMERVSTTTMETAAKRTAAAAARAATAESESQTEIPEVRPGTVDAVRSCRVFWRWVRRCGSSRRLAHHAERRRFLPSGVWRASGAFGGGNEVSPAALQGLALPAAILKTLR